MTVITMTELNNDLNKYTSLAKTEDVVVTRNGKPFIMLVNYGWDRQTIVDELAGCIHLDKPYEEIRYEQVARL